jgi:TPR repeat protein
LDYFGWRPFDLNDLLRDAVEHTHLPIIRFLLEKGANPADPGALERALLQNNYKIANMFLERGAKVNMDGLFAAIRGIGVDNRPKRSGKKHLEVFLDRVSPDQMTPDALRAIGHMHNPKNIPFFGKDCARVDEKKSIAWWRKAADMGNSNAMNDIACAYADGLGVKQDYAKARKWFEKAAALSHPSATYNLGKMRFKGDGFRKNRPRAFDFFEKAAELGEPAAQRMIRRFSRKKPR